VQSANQRAKEYEAGETSSPRRPFNEANNHCLQRGATRGGELVWTDECRMTDWFARYIELAEFVAGWSNDESSKVGAVIYDPHTRSVLSIGCSGFPRGVKINVSSRDERSVSCKFSEHAERAAIFSAALHGLRTERLGIAVPFFPCPQCARAIVQSGIRELVCIEPVYTDLRSDEVICLTKAMFAEAGVNVIYLVRVAGCERACLQDE